jgi:hypothetical protein
MRFLLYSLPMTSQSLAPVQPLLFVPPSLNVTDAGDHQVVHLGATPIAIFPVSDVCSRRHVIVQLAEAGSLKATDIAKAFDCRPVVVDRKDR